MSTFRFKHFTIQQSNAALKVGTDAMVLGSLCHWDDPKHLLDIGTGTGVLSLMCAQRFAVPTVTAIDISSDATSDASENIYHAPFKTQFTILKRSLQEFEGNELFDAIISNPPYFENSMKNADDQLSLARHTDSLSFEELIEHISRLLTINGVAWIIVPEVAETKILRYSKRFYLFVIQKTKIYGKPGKHIRTIFALSKIETRTLEKEFTIRTIDGDYSSEYKELTKEFHDRRL